MRDSFSGMRVHSLRNVLDFLSGFTLLLSHIDLSCDSSGDQGGAVFLEPLDSLLDFGHKGFNLGGFAVKEVGNGVLDFSWGKMKFGVGHPTGFEAFHSCAFFAPHIEKSLLITFDEPSQVP